ncbi:MAG: serine hydroxymethyltransferase [Victivallaceae bacterium]|nr:serine hydroxymethyltransferase [Victivallaceae bacterium]
MSILKSDIKLAEIIRNELFRQRNSINLIASENYVSPSVIEAQINLLTNKYACGYPDHRYYAGCRYMDEIENLAIERAETLFSAEHANLQPYSGAQANFAVYFSSLEPGDTILAMDRTHGGHLTHGDSHNFSGRYFDFNFYGLDKKTERIDYQKVLELALKKKPKLIIAGSSSYSRLIDFKIFGEIAEKSGACLMADIAHIAGIVAAGLHPSPVSYSDFVTMSTHKTLRGPRGGIILCKRKYADTIDKAVFPGIQGGPLMQVIAAKAVCLKEASLPEFKKYQKQVLTNARMLAGALKERGFILVSGGTDNHMMTIDLRNKNVTACDAEKMLEHIGINVSRCSLPFDIIQEGKNGIRIGTPSVTSRGMSEKDMSFIAGIISMAVENFSANKKKAALMVKELLSRYPLYPEHI